MPQIYAPPPRACYAADPARSRGRLHPEPESARRTPFQRDRDRVLHSTGFRRLKHKTQVFVASEGDHFRTRLTHSIEVAQIARDISRSLGLDEDLAETVALSHDLGHTPFGHAGERILDELMQEYGGFDHNAQSLRVVTVLEHRYAAFDGLNLTWETLEGLVKHNGPLPAASSGALPWALAEYAAQHDLELHTQASAEAQIAALADDIAYNNHDIDDALRAGLFRVADLMDLPLIGDAFREVDALYPDTDRNRRRAEAIRRSFGAMVEDAMLETQRRLQALQPETAQDIRNAPRPVADFSDAMKDTIRTLRAFLAERMYYHPSVARMNLKSRKVLQWLFAAFMEEPRVLPVEWATRARAAGNDAGQARVIADYIAGMTDLFALDEYRRLTDPRARA